MTHKGEGSLFSILEKLPHEYWGYRHAGPHSVYVELGTDPQGLLYTRQVLTYRPISHPQSPNPALVCELC